MLRLQEDAGGAVAGGIVRIAQTDSASHERHGNPLDIPRSQTERGRRESEVPLSSARSGHRSSEPHVGDGHHLRPAEGRLHVSYGVSGLVLPLRGLVGIFGLAVGGVRDRGAGGRLQDGPPENHQQRSGVAVHEQIVCRADSGRKRRHRHQHGRKGALHGQHLHREILEELQAGGSVSEGVRESPRGSPLDGGVHTAL